MEFSQAEKAFARAAILGQVRPDGRTHSQRRPRQLETQVLDNLAASARLSLDHCRLSAGLKVRVAEREQGRRPVQTHLELSTMARLSRNEGRTLVYLEEVLRHHWLAPLEEELQVLAIPQSQQHCLQIHLQVLLLVEPHPSLLQPLAALLGSLLSGASLPRVRACRNLTTEEETVEVVGGESCQVDLKAVDTLLVLGSVAGRSLLDLTALEFEAVDAAALVALRGERVVAFEILKGTLLPEDVQRLCKFAVQNRQH